MLVEKPQVGVSWMIIKNDVTDTGAANDPMWLACAKTIRQLYFPKQQQCS
jgi:hypothetical protein